MQKFKTVDEFLASLSDDKRSQVHKLRELILDTEPSLEEHIKWNAPSYVLDGEDRITFNVNNKEDAVKLVLHMGATRKEDKTGAPIIVDTTGLVSWSSDIRGMLSFRDLEDITSKEHQLRQVLSQWLAAR